MFVCAECGYKSIKWLGRCPVCQQWETFQEDRSLENKQNKHNLSFGEKTLPLKISQLDTPENKRLVTGWADFDRILGGGIVPGEVVLIGGEPGVGKSTLLLQIAAYISKTKKTLYISAEESGAQLKLRASRLKVDFDSLYIIHEDNLVSLYEHIIAYEFEIVIVDSIQVVFHPELEAPRGSINQVRVCAEFFTRLAKSKGISIFIVGHVTKEGAIAGPKLLEHIVDCVLYFESEVQSQYRILRAVKNRFGATGEVAIFQMTSSGLTDVSCYADLFLPHKDNPVAGSCVGCVIEGMKPVLLEFQALVAKSSFGMVRRRCLGYDFNRFSLLTAIIEKRLKLAISSYDIFLNIAGGLRVVDPAADLAVLSAILASYYDYVLPLKSVFIGEVGLAGELRPVSHMSLRFNEMVRAGFEKCFLPKRNIAEIKDKSSKIELIGLDSLKDISFFSADK